MAASLRSHKATEKALHHVPRPNQHAPPMLLHTRDLVGSLGAQEGRQLPDVLRGRKGLGGLLGGQQLCGRHVVAHLLGASGTHTQAPYAG